MVSWVNSQSVAVLGQLGRSWLCRCGAPRASVSLIGDVSIELVAGSSRPWVSCPFVLPHFTRRCGGGAVIGFCSRA